MVSTGIKSTSIVGDGDAATEGLSLDGSSGARVGGGAAVTSTSAVVTVADAGVGLLSQSDSSLIRLDQFRADSHFSGIDGHGVSVVVIDTGINFQSPFFGNRIVYSYDF